jgi:heme-degrading monooxygenase HmoA
MFSVLFELHPRTDRWDAYLGYGKMLSSELEGIDGFVDNIRYRSLTREGWLLSLSGWRDEKALIRWRTSAGHHGVQEKGRDHVLLDYHLRVGQLTRDSRLPEGCKLREQRLDETESGEATALMLIAVRLPDPDDQVSAEARSKWLGLNLGADGLVGWDVFTAVLAPPMPSCSRPGAIGTPPKPSEMTYRRRSAQDSATFVSCATTACSTGTRRLSTTPLRAVTTDKKWPPPTNLGLFRVTLRTVSKQGRPPAGRIFDIFVGNAPDATSRRRRRSMGHGVSSHSATTGAPHRSGAPEKNRRSPPRCKTL